MILQRLALRAALACTLLAAAPASVPSAPKIAPGMPRPPPPGDFAPRQLLRLHRCPTACTLGIEDLAAVYVTIRIPF